MGTNVKIMKIFNMEKIESDEIRMDINTYTWIYCFLVNANKIII